MTCNHLYPVYPIPYEDSWTGEMIHPEAENRYSYEDISVGAFRCTQCNHIGYYTGLWKAYYEYGVPCPGSTDVPRDLSKIPPAPKT